MFFFIFVQVRNEQVQEISRWHASKFRFIELHQNKRVLICNIIFVNALYFPIQFMGIMVRILGEVLSTTDYFNIAWQQQQKQQQFFSAF